MTTHDPATPGSPVESAKYQPSPGLDELQSLLNQIVSNGPLIDSLDAEAWGPADPRGVRLRLAIYEASRAINDYRVALPTQASDSPEKTT